MNIETVLIWSTCRSVIVTTVALPLSLLVWQRCAIDRHPKTNFHFWIPVVALTPLFVPDLLIGFTYRLTSARLVHSVYATELLYAGLLLVRIVSLQLAVRMILPGSVVAAESIQTWKLKKTNTWAWWVSWFRMLIRGPSRTPLIAWLGGCLFCFQDFETAALLQIDRHPVAWTVWLFDAHAAGEPLFRSLQYVVRSLLIQGLLLLPAIALLYGRPGAPALQTNLAIGGHNSSHKGMRSFAGIFIIACSAVVVVVWPIGVNSPAIAGGFRSLLQQDTLWQRSQQILLSLTIAATAASLAISISVTLRNQKSQWGTLLTLLPGLCGALVLSLVLLAMFQLPVLNRAYDTWVPILLGQTVLLMPRAWLLVTLLQVLTDKTSLHSAELMIHSNQSATVANGTNLMWQFGRRRWLLAGAVLTHWCFWDVTIASTLRPVRFEPIVTRLYNEMHYGRTESLIAITVLAMLIPLMALVVVAGLLKQIPYRKAGSNV